MASVTSPGPLSTKPLARLRETTEETHLHRSVGALDLTAFEIGAIIGTGIFVIIGEAIPIALIAALLPLSEIAELVNIGTLFAFLIVNLAVIWLRRTKPNMERGFRVPFVPVFPLIGAALCVYLMTKLPLESWIRFIVWLVLGHVVYAAYGYRHSLLRREP
jgi:APA family basic amino acid/polyamine antiporter